MSKELIKKIAKQLDGREYPFELSSEEQEKLEQFGIVVVVGQSNDIMQFLGAIRDEVYAYNGGKAYLNAASLDLLSNPCDDDECPYHKKECEKAVTVNALWDKDGYSFIFETDIPHSTFEVKEDGGKYCRGIVFSKSDVRMG